MRRATPLHLSFPRSCLRTLPSTSQKTYISKAIATRKNPPREGGSIELTNRLRNIVNARSPDIRDIPPDKARQLIESLISPGACFVISLSGDLRRDRIKGMTLPLYDIHGSKVWTNDQFIFSRIPKANPFLEDASLSNYSGIEQRSWDFGAISFANPSCR